MDISELLMFAVKQGASDVHLSSGEPPIVRVSGDMKRVKVPVLTKEEVHGMIYDVMNDNQRKVFEEIYELDFSIDLGTVARFRVNAFRQRRGEAAVFRQIPTEILSMEQLGLPPICRELCDRERGLILCTGPTGSGKSTTLAAMVDFINREKAGHILTVEDPIEFVHQSKNCLISQRELGPHTHSFANALKSALREDPDYILVGEMRDLETISLALTAAETGHLVFGTLHTSSAPKTVDRIIDVFPSAQQAQVRAMFAESIVAVISQALLRRKEKGRVGAQEIMIGVPAVRNLIREGKIHQIPSAIQTGQKFGMQTLEQAVLTLYEKGIVSREEALLKCPGLFREEQVEQRKAVA
ncbi:MAG: type IV pilus twitching motility protein PilT [Candidatus Tectomicrobia bacterium]|nr:type IV pilus twitching motility protein PilT [Candidatus Tectomicrobia bacterium]